MSATTQTESPKQAPPSSTNGTGQRRARAPKQAAAKPAPQDKPALTETAKVQVATKPAPTSKVTPAPPSLLVQGLFESFPQSADIVAAKDWLDTASAVLKMTCKFSGSLSVTAVPGAA